MNDESYLADGEADANPSGNSGTPAGELRPFRNFVARPTAPAGKPTDQASHETHGAGGGLAGYLHAYRRLWFLATSLGLICGAAAAAAVWISATTNYTAAALIQIASSGREIVPTADKSSTNFEVYKGTQMQLITSDFVLIAAMRDPKVAGLELLKREEDPIRWLSRSLQVEAPGNTELVRISLTTPDKDSSAVIVQAVIDAYLKEVVNKESAEREKRLADLESAFTKQENELRAKRIDLKKSAEISGSGDKGALSRKELIALQEYADARTELNRLHGEMKRHKYAIDDNEAKMAAVKAGRAKPATAGDIDNAVNADPESVRLQQALAALDDEMSESNSTLRAGGSLAKTLADRYARIRKSLEEQLAAHRKKLADHLKIVKSGDTDSLEAEAQRLQAEAVRLAEEEQQAVQQVEALRKETDKIGNSSIEVEMERAEISETEKTFSTILDERAHAKLDLDSAARISLRQPASVPTAPDRSSRLQNAISAGVFGFLAPVGLLLWWDVRGRRINSVHDISQGLKLRVIGTVPHVVDSRLSRMRPDSRRRRQTQICLDQSIDGIAAKLCLGRGSHNARVVLVSSATRGEGKSTLSIQLAKRLARTGSRTLLVDFDLRKPTLHHVFDKPRAPGLSDFLRGDGELGAIVSTTEIDNLSLLTAGSPFANSLGTLANGVTRSLFEKVREEYEFVVVDGSPILPVVDSLLASQHVDSVLLAIRRDVSQISRVQSACDQLAQFGVEEFAAVLTGSNEDLYYYDDDHEQLALAAGDSPKPR